MNQINSFTEFKYFKNNLNKYKFAFIIFKYSNGDDTVDWKFLDRNKFLKTFCLTDRYYYLTDSTEESNMVWNDEEKRFQKIFINSIILFGKKERKDAELYFSLLGR